MDMASLISSLLVLFLIFQNSCYCFRSPLSVFKRYEESTRSLSNDCLGTTRPVMSPGSSDYTLDIRMPGVTPTESDTYLCKSYRLPVDDEAYVVDYRPHANMDTAHHMLLFGCNVPSSTDDYWDCSAGTCNDKSSIMYAWAKNAPPTKLPEGVGFQVGGKSGSRYFVLQVHYGDVKAFQDKHKDCTGVTVRITPEKQPLIAGIYLSMSLNTVVPPGQEVVNSDIACLYNRPTIHPFAYRVHTHQLGQVVSGFRVRHGKWTLIGRQSPQLPQAFYPVEHPLEISPGDIIATRCLFTGKGRMSATYIGGTAKDEMCNLYIMYYMDAAHATSYMTCVQTGNPKLFENIPEIANVPIPVSPDMMMMMMMGHGHHHTEAEAETNTALQQPKREEEEVLNQDVHLEEDTDWPGVNLKVGQVSGLALDPKNNLVIFHRGDHVWDENSFDRNFVYQQRGIGPIQESTILVVDPNTSKVLKSTGQNLFFLPHGLTIDRDGNYWVTDVALHQVFKVGAEKETPLLVLGRAFQPGSDRKHFCQPTDVAVDPITGNFFVADGYCNSRIMQFSPNGMFIMQWGEETSSNLPRPGQFRIPHSLTMISDQGQLCVADRENGRIQCFHAKTGEFVKQIKHQEFGREVFAVSYAPGGVLYAVNGKPYYGDSTPVQGFMLNFSNGDILDTFIPARKNFEMPHDIAAGDDGTVYVGDAHANAVWKFSPSKAEHRSVKKAGIEVEEITETEIFETHMRSRPKTNESVGQQTQEKPSVVQESSAGVSFVLIITLLIIPVVVLIAIAIFIRWRKVRMYGGDIGHKSESSSGGILGKLRGKGSGGLNLGTFFATHKGYSRKGFDRLSTEGSDQEKDDDDDGSDSEEEYSAPPIPPVSSS
ncbi:peptidyl-glycine alpha-amidating monooxygenase B precursor [Xenopus laevis]|uniref:Peptidyl-glycine alpha-amidating monooxygenase B n=1 Tax=Xenopus laevis TaxID=8355 RepID=AMDB_XENLA|nr:peptidyl-glycine alpha-amidating monooxygenase B precursor [Xenopus laevis]P12890.1 RecName: Full=Peptidyl-glycine alpha-amidating monooxygenase B; Short=PAM-B; AltName: Full=Peptide C-terminal alpha-amidating enzyme II; Short=AE-II; AltName: Full=Peptidyl-glycine alpha-amidating monooxygenase II; Includes: RecName: Full=Peptidylglycine alpha-hydroxylating monooxygenase B; Short=PHM-B; Includes: RecName: Full=Peptidyl-alpha-hydroxyglycine alpha-amidating lyase B; AltName: Full=Peptidylamidoglyc